MRRKTLKQNIKQITGKKTKQNYMCAYSFVLSINKTSLEAIWKYNSLG